MGFSILSHECHTSFIDLHGVRSICTAGLNHRRVIDIVSGISSDLILLWDTLPPPTLPLALVAGMPNSARNGRLASLLGG